MKLSLTKSIYKLKYHSFFSLKLYLILLKFYRLLRYNLIPTKIYLKNKFKKTQGYLLDLKNPKTLNEKINWLKINYRHSKEKILADKLSVRDEIRKLIGEEYLIPLIFYTHNPREINSKILPDFPVIIKASHDSGHYKIIRDKNIVDWRKIHFECTEWLFFDYFWLDREPQYRKIPRYILVEKLLICKNNKIPNDYKFHCFNGKVEFIYVSIDREGENKRNIYTTDWKPLFFTWASNKKDHKTIRGNEIPPPNNLKKMIEIAEFISKEFPYIRVDLYDVDGKIYFGELTQHHSGGFDQIKPTYYDYYFGNKLKLS